MNLLDKKVTLYVRSMGKALRVTGIFSNDDDANEWLAKRTNDGVIVCSGDLVFTADKYDPGIAFDPSEDTDAEYPYRAEIFDFSHDVYGNPNARANLWHGGHIIARVTRRQQCGYVDARDEMIRCKAPVPLKVEKITGDRAGTINVYYSIAPV